MQAGQQRGVGRRGERGGHAFLQDEQGAEPADAVGGGLPRGGRRGAGDEGDLVERQAGEVVVDDGGALPVGEPRERRPQVEVAAAGGTGESGTPSSGVTMRAEARSTSSALRCAIVTSQPRTRSPSNRSQAPSAARNVSLHASSASCSGSRPRHTRQTVSPCSATTCSKGSLTSGQRAEGPRCEVQDPQHLAVQQAVGGEGGPVPRSGLPVEGGERARRPPARSAPARRCRRPSGRARPRRRAALRDEHVRPEVAERPGAPRPPGESEQRLEPAGVVPALDRVVADEGVLQGAHAGHVDRLRVARRERRGPGARARRCPPATAERRGGRDPDDRFPSTARAMRVPQTGWPRRKFVVPSIGSTIHCRPSSRSPPYSSPRIASSRALRGEDVADRALDGGVTVGDRRAVRLRLDAEIGRAETGAALGVGGVREAQREGEVVGDVRHGLHLRSSGTAAAVPELRKMKRGGRERYSGSSAPTTRPPCASSRRCRDSRRRRPASPSSPGRDAVDDLPVVRIGQRDAVRRVGDRMGTCGERPQDVRGIDVAEAERADARGVDHPAGRGQPGGALLLRRVQPQRHRGRRRVSAAAGDRVHDAGRALRLGDQRVDQGRLADARVPDRDSGVPEQEPRGPRRGRRRRPSSGSAGRCGANSAIRAAGSARSVFVISRIGSMPASNAATR